MPDKTGCPRCQKTGLVRSEHVIRGGRAERHFYCGNCNHSWAVDEAGHIAVNQDNPPDRSRPRSDA